MVGVVCLVGVVPPFDPGQRAGRVPTAAVDQCGPLVVRWWGGLRVGVKVQVGSQRMKVTRMTRDCRGDRGYS